MNKYVKTIRYGKDFETIEVEVEACNDSFLVTAKSSDGEEICALGIRVMNALDAAIDQYSRWAVDRMRCKLSCEENLEIIMANLPEFVKAGEPVTILTNREKAIEIAICTFFSVDGECGTDELYDALEKACKNSAEQSIDRYLQDQNIDACAWVPFEGKSVIYLWEIVNNLIDHTLNLFGENND